MSNPRSLNLADHNLRVHRPLDEVLDAVRETVRHYGTPDVLTFHEAYEYAHHLRRVLPGYRVHFHTGWAKAADNVIAARTGLDQELRSPMRMHTRWTGPSSPVEDNQPGRTWPVLDIGTRWRLAPIHRCTGHVHGPNRDAGREEQDEIERLARLRGTQSRGLVLPGDWNSTLNLTDPRAIRGVAKAIGGEVISPGPGVDHAVVRGVKGKGRTGPKFGSDHPSRYYDLRVPLVRKR